MSYNLDQYKDPFDALTAFGDALGTYTGAEYVVLTDCCTHALELCLRYQSIKDVILPHRTYLSIPMLMRKLDIRYAFDEFIHWRDENEHRLVLTNIWDSARKFQKNMYRPGNIQCLSFGNGKPLQIGTGGAILTDDFNTYTTIKEMAYDGRNLNYKPWADQEIFSVGYHYMMRPEFAVKGLNMLENKEFRDPPAFNYPDLREIKIV